MPITFPLNLDGSKLAAKYNLGKHDFWVENGMLFVPSLPGLTEADLLDCVITPEELAEIASQTAARQQLKDEYVSAIAALRQIEDEADPTVVNLQVILRIVHAVQFLAKSMRLLLKFLASQYK